MCGAGADMRHPTPPLHASQLLAAGVPDIVVFHRVMLPLPDIILNRCVLHNPEIVFIAKWRSMCQRGKLGRLIGLILLLHISALYFPARYSWREFGRCVRVIWVFIEQITNNQPCKVINVWCNPCIFQQPKGIHY